MQQFSRILYSSPCFILLIVLVVLFASDARAQNASLESAIAEIQSDNFFDQQAAINAYFDSHPEAGGRKQWQRREWYLEQRLYPSGTYRNLTKSAVRAYQQVMSDQNTMRATTHGFWNFIGPISASGVAGLGRLNCIAIHPGNHDIIYVGAANGGVWKTTDGGANWTNISPHIPLLSVADIAIDPFSPSVIYVLTGDGDPAPLETGSHAQTEVTSIGVIKSFNGGATWHRTGFSFEHPSPVRPIKLLIHPTNPNIQFVAAQDGLYRTIDGWETNTIVAAGPVFDIEFKPGDETTMYCGRNSSIMRSTNTGITWNLVSDADFSILSNAGRIELAVSPEEPNGVYALAGNWRPGLVGFYRSLSSGDNNTWSLMDSSTNSHGKFTQYCVGLAADSSDFSTVYGGMQWINMSTGSGVANSWSSIVNGTVHADIHDIVHTSNALFVACDGGLYKSVDDGANWTDLSDGLGITEVYRIAGTPQNTALIYCGNQDNGTMKRNSTANFTAAFGGDGMTCRIDYTNSNIVFGSSQNGSFKKSTNGGTSNSNLNVPGDESAWISPMIMDPVDPLIVFFGKDSVYRTDDGGTNFVFLGMPSGGDLNVLAQGTSNRNRLYASEGPAIYRTNNALTTTGPASWVNIGAGLPNFFITDITVDPDDATRLWVTLSGYSAGTKVFLSDDSGSTWSNISGSLPNIPINCIAYRNTNPNIDAMYIGTDIGVFYRDDNLGDWIYFSNSMPAVNVNDLYVHPGGTVITAGTYGRGLWSSPLYSGCDAMIVLDDGGTPLGGVHWNSASSQLTSTAEYRFDLGTEIHYTAGQRVLLNPGFRADGQVFFEAEIGPCPSVTTPATVQQHPIDTWVGPTFTSKEQPIKTAAKGN